MGFDDFKQQLKDRLDIVDVIGSYVTLRRRGRDCWACCPFHNEKTPSFHVDSSRQMYHCFGCGESGDVIKFVMKIERCEFIEAIEKLAARAGMEMPRNQFSPEQIERRDRIARICAVLRDAARFYRNSLLSSDGARARNYLESRGIGDAASREFGLGCSPDSDSLVRYLEKKGHSFESMRDSGAIATREGGRRVDFMSNRLVIPVISHSGKAIGFSGRTLDDNPGFAKYKNTPNTPVFSKRSALFGLYNFLRCAPRDERSVILVEGHMDVISLHCAGIKNCVASMGTALTDEQCALIKRFCDDARISFDGDSAGQSATLRGLDLLKKKGLTVKVVELPKNADPDEYVREFGRDGYLKLVADAMPLTDFKLKKIREKYDLERNDERAKYVTETLPALRELDPIERDVYEKAVAAEGRVSQKTVSDAVRAGMRRDSAPAVAKRASGGRKEAVRRAKDFVIAAMLNCDPCVNVGDFDIEIFDDEPYATLFEYVRSRISEKKRPAFNYLFNVVEDDERAKEIVECRDRINSDAREKYYRDCLGELRKTRLRKELRALVAEYANGTDEGRKAEIAEKIRELEEKLKKETDNVGKFR